MDSHRGQEPAVTARQPDHHMVTLAQSASPPARPEYSHTWSEGRERFLQLHQERYLQRLALLREALLRDKDLVRLSLPKNCYKNTGFWEAIMDDIEDSPTNHKFPSTKSQRPYQASVGGSLSSEQNRRGHLERLRRIRVMQMRRRLPPQLEPLHGIGLGGKKEPKPRENKQIQRVPPTTYHIDWMKGNHMITPIGDQEKAISSWALKHLRTVDAAPPNETDDFPNDIRTLLRRTRHSPGSAPIVTNEPDKQHSVAITATATPVRTRTPATQRSLQSRTSLRRERLTSAEKSVPQSGEPHMPPPAPVSSPSPQSPFMSEIISHHSSSSSRVGSIRTIKHAADELDLEMESGIHEPEIERVDKASSPVGFRLPSLEQEKRGSITSSANSKRHIIVKIPHGIK